MNNSAGTFNLTPGTSYTCQYWDNLLNPAALLGELSWNSTTKKLTVKGVDLHRRFRLVSNNATNEYDGLATLYVSGTFTVNGTSQLCGAVSGGNCSLLRLEPERRQSGDHRNGAAEQRRAPELRALPGQCLRDEHRRLSARLAQFDGPMVAGTFRLANSVQPMSSPRSRLFRSAGRATRPSTPNPSLLRTIRGRACSPERGILACSAHVYCV